MKDLLKENVGPTLALFASASTLLCCALPALLVTVGAGAVMAGIATNVPGFIWLTANKPIIFGVAGLLLVGAFFVKWLNRNAPCPVDPKKAQVCDRLKRTGTIMLTVAVITYVVGGFFAFFADDILL